MLQLAIEIAIVLALICLNGVLAMSEIAVVSSRRVRLQQRAEAGDERAKAALALAMEPTRFLSTVQIGITLVGVLAGAFGGTRIADRITQMLAERDIDGSLIETLVFAGVVLSITYLSIVLGELVPKRIGLTFPERIAALIAPPMRIVARAGAPFVAVMTVSTNAVVRLLRIPGNQDEGITEEELRLLIGTSAKSGSMTIEEADLLDRVFHFGDRKVHEVMVPRTEVVWLDATMKLQDFFETYARTPHSRFPAFDGNPDNVIGILGIKDVLAAEAHGWLKPESPLRPLLRQPLFIPETKSIGELFREMQEAGVQMAVAVDEFGGTAGIVTMEQLLEEMVGPMHDELRPAENEIREVDALTTRVDGSLSVEEARDELGIDIPEGPYDTIAGFVLNELGHIPETGEQVAFDGYRITVEEMRGPKIETLKLTRIGG